MKQRVTGDLPIDINLYSCFHSLRCVNGHSKRNIIIRRNIQLESRPLPELSESPLDNLIQVKLT